MKVKKILSLVVLSSVVLSNRITVSAQTSDLSPNKMFVIDKLSSLPTTNSDNFDVPESKLPVYGEREYSTVLKTEHITKVVEPTGQPTDGYSFPKGGSVYVNTSGGLDLSLSFSLTWGIYTLGVSTGYVASNNIGGLAVNIPAGNGFYKVKLAKHYDLSHVRVDCYKFNEFKYSYYKTKEELTGITPIPERIK